MEVFEYTLHKLTHNLKQESKFHMNSAAREVEEGDNAAALRHARIAVDKIEQLSILKQIKKAN
ncbi:hypothetical protein [Sporosarcina sp. FSL K6-5500]|uniref:hypothetical protein n=1 Tax=Sporosarcina sp. FSL K6-5500 TaxID=2921558 RepID=UPI0030F973D1